MNNRDLFDDHHQQQRQKAVNATIDNIRAQFGTGSIQRGSLLNKSVMEPEGK
jgi:hypothetical protein